jgi:hypothetical protein
VQCHMQDREKEGCRLWLKAMFSIGSLGGQVPCIQCTSFRYLSLSQVGGVGGGEGEGEGGGGEGVLNEDFAEATF